MIAAAVLEVKDIMPDIAIDLALTAPMEVSFPLAPAEGLVLVDAGIGRMKFNTEVNILSQLILQVMYSRTISIQCQGSCLFTFIRLSTTYYVSICKTFSQF